MYSVVCTGTNERYGKAGERKLLCNDNMRYAIKAGYILPKARWAGNEGLRIKV